MTKQILEQYTDLQREVRYLEKEIDSLKNDMTKNTKSCKHDVVKGSSHEYPYTEQHYHIEGLTSIKELYHRSEIDEQIKKLGRRYTKLLQMTNEVLDYIDSIDDSFMRMIITYRFIEDYKWNEVADAMGGGNTEDSVKKAFYRFIGKE